MAILATIKETFGLIRFSHTVFALPFALASMLVAAGGLPPLRILLLIIVCMVLARTSAMSFNRLIDRDIDAANPRTQDRHLPSGTLSVNYVRALSGLSGLAFIGAAAMINQLTLILAPLALLILWAYSYTKRLTHYAQLFLGLALGISPIGAWIAVTGHIALPPIILGIAVLFWVAGFDIFYACMDREFDRRQGLKSLVVLLGLSRALLLAKVFHVLTALFLLYFTVYLSSQGIYLLSVAVVIGILFYEDSLVKTEDLSRIDKAFFTLNGWIGFVFLLGIGIATFF